MPNLKDCRWLRGGKCRRRAPQTHVIQNPRWREGHKNVDGCTGRMLDREIIVTCFPDCLLCGEFELSSDG